MSTGEWLPDVALLVIKTALILAMAPLLCALCRSATARARHSILAAALVVVAFLPLLAKVAPSWEISWPEALTAQTESSSGARQRSANHAADASSLESAMLGPSAEQRNIDFTSPAAPERQALSGTIRPGAVFAIWAVIASVLAIRALIAFGAARRIVNSATQAPLVIQHVAERLATRVNLRPPSMRVSERTQTPFLWGWRPVVVLPAAASSWSEYDVEMVLAHEFAHARAGDWALRQLATVVCVLHWFNPFAWIVARRLELESECACDEEALNQAPSAPAYAQLLVVLARQARDGRRLRAVTATGNQYGLKTRIQHILAERSTQGGYRMWTVLVVAAMTFAGVHADQTLVETTFESRPIAAGSSIINDIPADRLWRAELSASPKFGKDVTSLILTVGAGAIEVVPGKSFRVDAVVWVDKALVEADQLVKSFEGHVLVERRDGELRVRDKHSLEASRTDARNPWQVSLVVHVPRFVDVVGAIGAGNVVVNAPRSAIGAANLATGAGSIRVDAASAPQSLTLTTGSGHINVAVHEDGPRADSIFKTGSGHIELDFPASTGGDIVMSTGIGHVRVNGKNSPRSSPVGSTRTFSFDGAGPHHAATATVGNIVLNTHE